MFEPDSEKNVHWYYRDGEKTCSPVLLSRLRQMSHRGTLTSEDLVRKGKTGERLPAGNFQEIDSRQAVKPIANEKVAEAAPITAPVSSPNRISVFFESISDRLRDFVSDFWWEIQGRGKLIRTTIGYLVLVVVTVGLLRQTAGTKLLSWSKQDDPYQTCRVLWDELQLHRKSTADDAIWREFTERGQAQMAPIAHRLEREASANNRSAQLLLWASRDCLPKMFQDARQEPSRSEEQLAEYMGNVDRLRAGRPIYGSNRTGGPANASIDWLTGDSMTTIFGIVITVINFGFIGWLFFGGMVKRLRSSNG